MAYTFDQALSDPSITVVNRNDRIGSYAIRIGTLSPIVTIEIGRYPDEETTKFVVSHHIHTPSQAGPYRTSTPFGDYPAYALHRAIQGITSYYREAIKAGHQPNDNWLVSA